MQISSILSELNDINALVCTDVVSGGLTICISCANLMLIGVIVSCACPLLGISCLA
jgi:hypothetical protein